MRSILILLLFLAACASGSKQNAAAPNAETRPIVIGESRTIASAGLGEMRAYNVYLPPSYGASQDRRYPVLYLLDGGLDQDFHHIAGLAQYGALSGHYEEMIVVGVATKDRRRELTYPTTDRKELADFPTSGGAAAFRQFIERELKPAVDGLYRTDGREGLMGESLAGLFVVWSFLTEPQTADIYIAISPSLWWDAGRLGKSARDRMAAEGAPKEIYLAIASEKGVMRDSLLSIVAALETKKPERVAWFFSDRPDLGHADIYHREALEALEWAFAKDEE